MTWPPAGTDFQSPSVHAPQFPGDKKMETAPKLKVSGKNDLSSTGFQSGSVLVADKMGKTTTLCDSRFGTGSQLNMVTFPLMLTLSWNYYPLVDLHSGPSSFCRDPHCFWVGTLHPQCYLGWGRGGGQNFRVVDLFSFSISRFVCTRETTFLLCRAGRIGATLSKEITLVAQVSPNQEQATTNNHQN